jgi:hypothetical protein
LVGLLLGLVEDGRQEILKQSCMEETEECSHSSAKDQGTAGPCAVGGFYANTFQWQYIKLYRLITYDLVFLLL